LALGGRTPEEWQHAIDIEWREKIIHYRDKFGPFNRNYRMDLAVARALTPFCKGLKPSDFMLWPIEEPEPEANIEHIIERIGRQNDIIAMRKGK
jgi:hypothetical protein